MIYNINREILNRNYSCNLSYGYRAIHFQVKTTNLLWNTGLNLAKINLKSIQPNVDSTKMFIETMELHGRIWISKFKFRKMRNLLDRAKFLLKPARLSRAQDTNRLVQDSVTILFMIP